MWLAKGILVGVWLFSFGTLAFLWNVLQPEATKAYDPRLLAFFTVSNPSWWLWLVACLALGIAIAHSLPIRPALWISLAVTELVPVGFLALILVLVSRLKQHTN